MEACYRWEESPCNILQDPQEPLLGRDPNYCQGVQSCCDREREACSPQNDPTKVCICSPEGALNAFDGGIGCNIGDGGLPQCSQLPPCLDAPRGVDLLFQKNSGLTGCDEDCWNLGGRDLIDGECSRLGGRECQALGYYCRWDNGVCKAHSTDPFDLYVANYGQLPPQEPQILPVREDCTPQDTTCWRGEGGTLKVSQSSWDPTQRTSTNIRTRIWCYTPQGGGREECITTPRCQYTQNPCGCGYRDGIWMCAKKVWKQVQSGQEVVDPQDILNSQVLQGIGYCTWCGAHQDEVSLPLDWLENDCQQRCDNPNLCEPLESETLWNECIWRSSQGTYGIDPFILSSLSLSQKQKILKEDGFCFDPQNQQHIQLIQTCENELSYLATINKNDVGYTPKCTREYTWNHTCLRPVGGEPQIAENYLCTWCDKLQCNGCSECGGLGTLNTTAIILGVGGGIFFILLSLLLGLFLI